MKEIENIFSYVDLIVLIVSIYIPLIIAKCSEKNKSNEELVGKTMVSLGIIMKQLEFNVNKLDSIISILEEYIQIKTIHYGRNLKKLNRKKCYWSKIILSDLKSIKTINTSNLDYLINFRFKGNILFEIYEYNTLVEDITKEVDLFFNEVTILNSKQISNIIEKLRIISDKNMEIKKSINDLDKDIDKGFHSIQRIYKIPKKIAIPVGVTIIFIFIASIIIRTIYNIDIFDFTIVRLIYFGLPILTYIMIITIFKFIL